MMNLLSEMMIAMPMVPARIFDGSVPPAEAMWGGWVWVGAAMWCLAFGLVGWIAVLRHVNGRGAAARLVKYLAKWRGLHSEDLGLIGTMIEAKGEVRQQEMLSLLLLPSQAAVALNRAWDRTEGVKRAGLISLREKLGVLEAERSGRLLEDGGGSGATISTVSSEVVSPAASTSLELEAQREHSN